MPAISESEWAKVWRLERERERERSWMDQLRGRRKVGHVKTKVEVLVVNVLTATLLSLVLRAGRLVQQQQHQLLT